MVGGCDARRIELDPAWTGGDDGSAVTASDGGDPTAGDPTPIDCSDVPPDTPIVCGQNEAVCAACGCAPCGAAGERACDAVPLAPYVLVCTDTGCWNRVPCAVRTYCTQSRDSTVSDCSDVIGCLENGCSGFPVCDPPVSSCGTCGCCSPVPAFTELCGLPPLGEPAERWILDTARQCYDIVQCGPGELCRLIGLSLTECFVP